MLDDKLLSGAGGGGKKPKPPTIVPDSLISVDLVEFTLGICEGPIAGLVTGPKSFYLDDTPLMSLSGDVNFDPFELSIYHGDATASEVRNVLGGITSNAQVGVQLAQNTPVTRTTAASLRGSLDKIEVRIVFNQLLRQTDKGDQYQHTAKFAIRYREAGSTRWLNFYDNSPTISLTGKTTSGYTKDFVKRVPRIDGDWEIQVEKFNPDGQVFLHADMTWESFQSVTMEDRAYDNLAVARGMGQASDQFSSIPQFSGVYGCKIIKIPSNYDPVTRYYDGPWDGTFKLGHTDNPAWCFYDLVMNETYGMKYHYPHLQADRFSIYDAARWCDEFVPRPGGGYQPRFTYNDVINQPRSALELCYYIAGLFGGVPLSDLNGMVQLRVDRPGLPVQIFGPESVSVDGFQYSFTDITTRPNDITVKFINPNLEFQEDVRNVFDQTLIDTQGRITEEIVAIGCNDVYEAQRRAQRRLVQANTETVTVTFETARMGIGLEIYDLIGITDPSMAWGISGRVLSYDNGVVSLRDPLLLPTHIPITMTVQTKTGPVDVQVTTDNPATRELTVVSGTWPTNLPERAQFALSASSTMGLVKPFRVLNVEEDANNPEQLTITAVEHNVNKFSDVDNMEMTDTIDYGFLTNARPAAPTIPALASGDGHVVLNEDGSVNNRIFMRMKNDPRDLVREFEVFYRIKDRDDFTVLLSQTPEIYISNVEPGEIYEIKARVISAGRDKGYFTPVMEYTPVRDTVAPPQPTNWWFEEGLDTLTFQGDRSPANDFREFRLYGSEDMTPGIAVVARSAMPLISFNPDPLTTFTYYTVVAVDLAGNESEHSAPMMAETRKVIDETDLKQEVRDKIQGAKDTADQARDAHNALIDGFSMPNLGEFEADYDALTAGFTFPSLADFEADFDITADAVAAMELEFAALTGDFTFPDLAAFEAAFDVFTGTLTGLETDFSALVADFTGTLTDLEVDYSIAVGAVTDAVAARDASESYMDASEAAKEASEIAKTQAQNSASNASGSANAASGHASTASTKAYEAGQSATAAAASSVTAGTAADNAVDSAQAASDSASAASASETTAGQSATAATTARNQAVTAKGQAETAATNAATSESNAAGSASTAGTSETNAAASETAAGLSATAASDSASTATSKATEASQSATAANTAKNLAVTAKGQAETAATNAATSESNAAGSASTAGTSETNAAASESAAGLSATAASDSASLASSKATAASQSATAATTARNQAVTAKGQAETAATNAATSETNAAGSASAAGTSETNAAASESAAGLAATAASGSASTASTKADEASQSATAATTARNQAVTAKGQAETAASNAATSETNAAGSESAAGTSETNAAGSESAAGLSATAASGSASTASTKADEASQSATAANTSKNQANTARGQAQTAATNAATSETNAGLSAAAAGTSETNAAASETAAGLSATAASDSASTASTKAGEAGTAATAATTARNQAVTAKGQAETAATNAATSETNASGSANTASQKATAAANSATTAGQKATAASNSASTASTKADEASTSATAANTARNQAVTAKGQAETAATNAATSETNAEGSASAAGTSEDNAAASETAAGLSATAASGSASTASTKATEASQSATAANTAKNQAQTAKGQAETAATNAATSETNASGSANTASQKATAAANSATTAGQQATAASNSASTASTKAGEASTSATAANTARNQAVTAKGQAETAATNAATSESNASGSANSASTSASVAASSATEAARDRLDTQYVTMGQGICSPQYALINDTYSLAVEENGTQVFNNGTLVGTYDRGVIYSLPLNAGDRVTASGPFSGLGGARLVLAPEALAGTRFGAIPSRNEPYKIRILSLGGGKYRTSESGTPTVDISNSTWEDILPGEIKEVTFSGTGSTYIGVETTTPALAAAVSGNTYDRETLFPAHPEILFRRIQRTGSFGAATVQTASGYSYSEDLDTPIFAYGVGDGAGSDAEGFMPKPGLGDSYIIPFGTIQDYYLGAVESTEVTVVSASGVVVGNHLLDASSGPVALQEGNVAGAGSAPSLSADGPFYVTGTKPFLLVTNRSEIEYVVPGYRRAFRYASADGMATAASNSASMATTKATEASQSATAATTAKNQAETARGQAQTAATNAATSESNASGSANTASQKATAAANSATTAGQQATAASNSASTASTKAGEASTSATAANTARNQAVTAKGQAETAATNAATSETNASGSANTASQKATAAANSATTAGQKATAASNSASTASTKATEASTSATAATTARNAAQTARGQAQTAATNAATSESNASGHASSAFSSMSTAVAVSSQGVGVLQNQFLDGGWSNYGGTHTTLANEIYPTGNTRQFNTGDTSNRGLNISSTHAHWKGAKNTPGFRVEIEFELISGEIGGAGFLVDWRNTGTNNHRRTIKLEDMVTEPIVTGKVILGSVVVTRADPYEGTFDRNNIYFMSNYSSTGPTKVKNLKVHRIQIYPMTSTDATTSINQSTIAALDGSLQGVIGLRTVAGTNGAELELSSVLSGEGAGSTTTARLKAENILLEGSVLSNHMTIDGELHLDAVRSAFIMDKTDVYDLTNEGVYMGRTLEADATMGFGFSVTKVNQFNQQQILEVTGQNGLRIQNASFQRDLAVKGPTTEITTNQTITFDPEAVSFSLNLLGGGSGGSDATSSREGGRAGGQTKVILKDGNTTIKTWTANGGAVPNTGDRTGNTGSGESSQWGTGGANGTNRVTYTHCTGGGTGDASPPLSCTTQTRAGVAGANATGYGAGGGGGGDNVTVNRLHGGHPGKAGQFISIIGEDISGLANPKLQITIGAGGAGGAVGNTRGGNGSPGRVDVHQSLSKPFAADVIPLEPTQSGTLVKTGLNVPFPDFGAGHWEITMTIRNNMDIGYVDIGGGHEVRLMDSTFASFISTKTPVRLRGGYSVNRTFDYKFRKMGP